MFVEYKNGNTTVKIDLENGTKIRETEDNEFCSDFAENIDVKITDKCVGTNCKMCFEGSGPNGKHGDILNAKWVDTLHRHQEISIGGGNPLEHPDLVYFLLKLADIGVITNITVHQKHFLEYYKIIKHLYDRRLIYGIGVSVHAPTDELLEKMKSIPSTVAHAIVGVTAPETYECLKGKGIKVLMLGYKVLGRGKTYSEDDTHKMFIQYKTKWLRSHLPELMKSYALCCFDNLALEQLNVKELLSEEEWNKFYMGDEGSHTYYIDAVNETFSESSTAPLDKRYPVLDSVDAMFEKVKENHESY